MQGGDRPIRMAICWKGPSGYMAACWRALAARPEVEARVVVYTNTDATAPFSGLDFTGVDLRQLPGDRMNDEPLLRDTLSDFDADIVVVAGWAVPAEQQLVMKGFKGAKFVMTCDTPFRYTARQILGRFVYRTYFSKIDRAIVPGERAYQLMRVVGFPEAKIRRGLYGVDHEALGRPAEERGRGEWPRRFLFVGRLIEVKAIDTLMDAYAAYRERVDEPWPLTLCGTGDLAHLCKDKPGVEMAGFVQPGDMPAQWARSGALVISSRFDPWPLAIVESCAAGLPIVCTEACGSSVELVRDHENGRLVATDDADALAEGMRWCHERHDRLPEAGAKSRVMAASYSSRMWAERWVALARELMAEKS